MNYETRGKLEKTLRDYWKKKQKLEALNRKLKHIEKEIALFRGIYAEYCKEGFVIIGFDILVA